MDKDKKITHIDSIHTVAVEKKEPLLNKEFYQEKSSKTGFYIGIIVIIIAGIISGYFLSDSNKSVNKGSSTGVISISDGKKVYGSEDTSIFKDSTEGTLEKGGLDGEGTHKLIRPGGDNQTVYLTSSVIDLEQFEGKKVKVWGETQASQTAGWFMDVGRLEVI